MVDDIGDRLRNAPASAAGRWLLRLAAVLGIGLMLGACSKCDVPTWQHSSLGGAPAACHEGPPAH